MNHINKERIKSIIIITLFIASLIQVGILWGYSQRFPINFLAAIFGNRTAIIDDEVMAREELFVPFRLIVSNGNTYHWVINNDDKSFIPLWQKAKTYLSEIADGTLTQLSQDTDWGDITTKKGFVFEFRTGLRPDIIKWFLGASDAAGDMPSIYKIMIKPDSVDENLSEFYILNNQGRVFKYEIRNTDISKSIQNLVSTLENSDKNDFRVYTSMRDSGFDDANMEPDVLFVSSSPKFWPYNEISCSIPSRIGKMDELAAIILGSEKDRYMQYAYNDKTIQFNNNIDVYKIYSDGFLDYSYLSGLNTSDKGNIGDAVIVAYRFINQLKKLTNSKADIYLSGIDDSKQGYYILSFDYKINGMPVFLNYSPNNKSEKAVTNAITMEVSSIRVRKCSWVFRDFDVGDQYKYNDRLLDIMDTTNIGIKNVSVGYMFDSESSMPLEPLMIIEKKDSGIQTVKMPVEIGG